MRSGTLNQRPADKVLGVLSFVADPEMPGISIVDLGMVGDIKWDDSGLTVTLRPTFVGCPALAMIRRDAEDRLEAALGAEAGRIEVRYSSQDPWTSGRMAPSCFSLLKARGIAPPPAEEAPDRPFGPVACPWCGSPDTVRETLFGPTACRAVYYCRACRNPFEAIKPV